MLFARGLPHSIGSNANATNTSIPYCFTHDPTPSCRVSSRLVLACLVLRLPMNGTGGGKGAAFMEHFVRKPHKFARYHKAIKKFEDHICTIRESIMGGNWNQKFK